ncbi:hypothetical protein NDU88_007536 [Pleurodeles waltl]|uniref:Uncharacterized protein n=1 Tax=Pleurodeles waltl TaxID=8319 RepID=A0AAV7NWJ7_PLEWA|nr:hypothetical protein NDU88_007536 [Pleurodeles waltl]
MAGCTVAAVRWSAQLGFPGGVVGKTPPTTGRCVGGPHRARRYFLGAPTGLPEPQVRHKLRWSYDGRTEQLRLFSSGGTVAESTQMLTRLSRRQEMQSW